MKKTKPLVEKLFPFVRLHVKCTEHRSKTLLVVSPLVFTSFVYYHLCSPIPLNPVLSEIVVQELHLFLQMIKESQLFEVYVNASFNVKQIICCAG